MCNLEHSIRTTVSALALTAIMTVGSHADGLQQIENASQQDYQLPTLMAAAQQDPDTGHQRSNPDAEASDEIASGKLIRLVPHDAEVAEERDLQAAPEAEPEHVPPR